jgi:hypothetical protein
VARHGEEVRYANRRYHVMETDHSAVPLHTGRYAEIFERVSRNDPNFSPELRRYRTYNICQAARWSLAVPGDFLCVGVSFGVTPRTVFEFLDFAPTGRTYHLVDPFNAPAGSVFNNDPDLVRRQYPPDALVVIHRAAAPEGIPSGPFAFAHLHIGGGDAEIASAPLVYERLTPGGIVTFDAFSSTSAATHAYSRAFAAMNVEPFWLPSGQVMLKKA